MVTRTLLAPKADPLAQTVLQNVVSGIYDAQRQQEASRLREAERRGTEQRAQSLSLVERDVKRVRSHYGGLASGEQEAYGDQAVARLMTFHGDGKDSALGSYFGTKDPNKIRAMLSHAIKAPLTVAETHALAQARVGKIQVQQASRKAKDDEIFANLVRDTHDKFTLENKKLPPGATDVERMALWRNLFIKAGGSPYMSKAAGGFTSFAKLTGNAEANNARLKLSSENREKEFHKPKFVTKWLKSGGPEKREVVNSMVSNAQMYKRFRKQLEKVGGVPIASSLPYEKRVWGRKLTPEKPIQWEFLPQLSDLTNAKTRKRVQERLQRFQNLNQQDPLRTFTLEQFLQRPPVSAKTALNHMSGENSDHLTNNQITKLVNEFLAEDGELPPEGSAAEASPPVDTDQFWTDDDLAQRDAAEAALAKAEATKAKAAETQAGAVLESGIRPGAGLRSGARVIREQSLNPPQSKPILGMGPDSFAAISAHTDQFINAFMTKWDNLLKDTSTVIGEDPNEAWLRKAINAGFKESDFVTLIAGGEQTPLMYQVLNAGDLEYEDLRKLMHNVLLPSLRAKARRGRR